MTPYPCVTVSVMSCSQKGASLVSKKWVALVAVAMLALSGCSPDAESDLKRLALPVIGSDEALPMWHLWLGTWITVLAMFIFVFGLIMYAPIRYRRKSSDEAAPPQVRYNLPIEALYTIAPVILVAVFFFHTVQVQNNFHEVKPNPDNTIEVVGSKWQWTFNYLEPAATEKVTVHDAGDIEHLPELWLPVDETVTFKLRSPDVIHSFWIPEFYYKMDIIPGNGPQLNEFSVTPNRTGTFTGRCAELCGVYHSRMLFTVKVVSRADFDAHLAALKEAGQVGQASGQDNSTTVAGLGESEDH
jgi:cytochrome c oxidase subunit 2